MAMGMMSPMIEDASNPFRMTDHRETKLSAVSSRQRQGKGVISFTFIFNQ